MICKRRDQLAEDVQQALRELAALVHQEAGAIQAESPATMAVIDKLIENALGRKERAFGAYYEHRDEHGC
jgi:hypothetical protein